MDEFLFEHHLQACKVVEESTTCFEAFLLSDSEKILVREEKALAENEIEDFLQQSGVFENNLPCSGGIRLILQKMAKHPETFEPKTLSLPRKVYERMVTTMQLPLTWSESSGCVGPFFWSGFESKDSNKCLQIIYRKSDVKKKTVPRNWELTLSHEINSGITSGFFKGTARSDIVKCIECLTRCTGQIDHPLFLPILIFSLDVDAKEDKRHRDNRERVRVLEKAVSDASHIFTDPDLTKRDTVSLAQINSDLVDCHKEVLWKRPEGYLTIIESIESTLSDFKDSWPVTRKSRMERIHPVMERRLKFLRAKLLGISSHRRVTISRLKLVRSVLQNLVSLSIFREEKQMKNEKLTRARTLNLESLKEEERKGIRRAQRDLETMLETRKQTTISLLGAIFLPGAFFAAVFSTTFFDFQAGDAAGLVSTKFWVYWAVTVPVTITLLALWYLWQRRMAALLRKRDEDIREVEGRYQERKRSIMAGTWNGLY